MKRWEEREERGKNFLRLKQNIEKKTGKFYWEFWCFHKCFSWYSSGKEKIQRTQENKRQIEQWEKHWEIKRIKTGNNYNIRGEYSVGQKEEEETKLFLLLS